MKIKTLQQFKQAAFNGAYRGLRYQKFRRASNLKQCVWATADNRHCAIGWLIPGVREMPRNTQGDVFGNYARAVRQKLLAKPLQKYIDSPISILERVPALNFLHELQCTHDNSYYDLEEGLRSLAHLHNLTIPDET